MSKTAEGKAAPTQLVTDRLILRRARPEDASDLFEVYGDPAAMRYWTTVPHESLSVTEALVAKFMKARAPLTYFVIERDGRAIGTAGIPDGDEIGFILHPGHWRQGIMREAVEAIIDYIWRTTTLPRITADADPRNSASVEFMTALGFHETGRAKATFCVGGEVSDSVYFALERPKA